MNIRVVVGRRRSAAICALSLVAFALYLVATTPLRHWIVDDAGVSFAYARSLASNRGLVSQPDAPRVEGYSNFAWVALLSCAVRLQLFDPIWSPKIISGALVLGTLLLLAIVLVRSGAGLAGVALALLLVAGNTSLVVWTSSGMANALYDLLAVLLVIALASRHALAPYAAGIVAALMGATRVEGVAFGVALLLWPLIAGRVSRDVLPRLWPRAARGILTFTLLYGAYTAFRVLYFGRFLPPLIDAPFKNGRQALSFDTLVHTFSLSDGTASALADLSHAAFGVVGSWVVAISFALLCRSLLRRRWVTAEAAALWLVLLVAAGVYAAMPRDWMGEYRFGTVFIVLAAPAVVALASTSASKARWSPLRRGLIAAAIVASAAVDFWGRNRDFSRDPTVPFARIERRAMSIAAWARDAGVRGRTLLCADAGGTLWNAELDLVDLGGLTDPAFARKFTDEKTELVDYLLGKRRPALIEIHGYWTRYARLDSDPRFSSDYVPLVEYDDAWLKKRSASTLVSGVYARRDLVDREKLGELQKRLSRLSAVDLADQLGLDLKIVGNVR